MRTFSKWTALAALFILVSCNQIEDFGDFSIRHKHGVLGEIAPVFFDDEPGTKATIDPSSMGYRFEVGDYINVWSNSGTLLVYTVQEVINEGKGAQFSGGGFTLTEGETYHSSVPLIKVFTHNFHSLGLTYEGQVQVADNDADHCADYTYTYASSTCNNGDASFSFNRMNAYMMFRLTLPENLTLKELQISVDDESFFALDGTADIATGAFTAGTKSGTMTLKLGGDAGIHVTDGVLNAFLSVAPCAASEYVIRVIDSEDKIYTSPKISKTALEAGHVKVFETEVFEGENPGVAKIGNVMYETLEAAFAAAEDGDKITLIADCAGNGIVAPQGKFAETGLTVDFGGHTYTVDGNLVGSTGTESQAFQLLMGNKITFKNGTITSDKAKMLIQNYSDLTLQGMTLNLNTTEYDNLYTLSNNNGTVVIDGSTINAASTANSFAFDVCRYSSYPSVSVTVNGNSAINGDIEVYASGSDAKDGFSLTVNSGTIAGNLVIDPSAKAAIQSTPEKAKIIKANDVTLEAPTDFNWADNDENTKILVPKAYVAQIGDVMYETFAEAADAAQEGDIIELLDNAGTYTMSEGQTLKVKKNGKSITVKAPDEYVLKSTTTDGVTTYTLAEADYMFTNAKTGAVTYYNTSSLTALNTGGTFKLLKDVERSTRTASSAMAGGTIITFDLNGHTLTYTSTDASFLLSGTYGSESTPKVIEIVDNSETGGGKLVMNAELEITGRYYDVTIGEGVTVEGNSILIDSKYYNKLTVEGTIKGGDNFAVVTNGNTENANITIKDGAVLTSNGVAMYLPGSGTTTIEDGAVITGSTAIYVKSGILNIEGGEITGNGEKKDYEYWNNGCHSTGDALVVDNCSYPGGAPTVNVTGGTFTSINAEAIASYSYGDNDPIAHFVHGGYFSSELDRAICEEGKMCVPATDKPGYYKLGDVELVAQIGSAKYETLADAIAAVANGQTIQMIADDKIDVNGYAITIPSGKDITIDLNGKTVTGICSTSGTSALIRNLGTLTISDSGSGGKLIGGADPTWTWDGSDDYTGSYASNVIRNEGILTVNGGTLYNASTGSAAYAIDNYSAGKVTINAGTVDAKKASAIRMFYNNGGVVTVNGGTIGHYDDDDNCSYMGVQAQNGTNAVINVTGGTIVGNWALYTGGEGNSAVTISGGTFDGYVGFGSSMPDNISISGGSFYYWVGTYGSHTGFITGGTFYEELEESYIAEGYKVLDNSGVYEVVPAGSSKSTTASNKSAGSAQTRTLPSGTPSDYRK